MSFSGRRTLSHSLTSNEEEEITVCEMEETQTPPPAPEIADVPVNNITGTTNLGQVQVALAGIALGNVDAVGNQVDRAQTAMNGRGPSHAPETETEGASVGNTVPNDVNPSSSGGQNFGGGHSGTGGTSGERMWQGHLYVRGHRNDMVVPCAAVRYDTPHRPVVSTAESWPSSIHCDSTKLKQCGAVFQYMNEAISQWYVRFAPVDENGQEKLDEKLVQLVKVMVQRQLAFEIQCNETPSSQGTLYLWGMQVPSHGHSLLGVFQPSSE